MGKKRESCEIRVNSSETFIATVDSLLGVQASMITATTETEKAPALQGYRSLGGIALKCSDEVFADVGWVIFEINDSNHDEVRGVISTYNDYATYVLMRLARAERSCRLQGLFSDGKAGEYPLTLNDVVIENMLVQDTTAMAAFRAKGPQHSRWQNK